MRRRRSGSLAGALYLRIVTAVGAIGVAMAALALVIAARAIDRDSDADLVTAANVLFALMSDESNIAHTGLPFIARPVEVDDNLLSEKDAQAFHASADARMFAVFRDGRTLMRSDTAPAPDVIPRRIGFADFSAANGRWRSYGLAIPSRRLLLVVGERLHARHTVIRDIVARLALPLLALLPITALLLHLSLRSGLASLHRLSRVVAERSPKDLSGLDPVVWPRDLSVLVVALNRLFERVSEAIGREQGFTDDAAHQLRTPLAAIRIQAQGVVALLPPAEQERGRALMAGVDRASALVDQMLELARLEARAIDPARFDVRETAAAVIADHALLAARRGIEFDFEDGGPTPIVSDPGILEIAMAAITENAIKHSPTDATIHVAVRPWGSGALITITDQGRGVPLADRERLFDRFARRSGLEAGAGLGLAIARRAMTLLDGGIEFADPENGMPGAAVILTLPDLPFA